MLARLEELHPHEFQVIFRHFPLLSIHDKASIAGQAAEAAGAQDAFWEMHDFLFDRYNEWTPLSPEEFTLWLKDATIALGLDASQFSEDLDTVKFGPMMEEAFTTSLQSGLTGTPAILIDGTLFRLSPELPVLEATVRLLLLEDAQYREYPPMTLNPGEEFIARLELDTGEVVIQLYADEAPQAVNNFIFLAQSGWYDDNIIHLVIPETLVESGDPSGTGFGDPGYHYATEISQDLTFDKPGVVAITSNGPDTNGSKFFITLSALPELDGLHTIIGRVISGLDLLAGLDARDPLENILDAPGVRIEMIVIEKQ